MHLFYTPDISGDVFILNKEESKHCIKVIRLGLGDKIFLIDGAGGFYTAEITTADSQGTKVKITDAQKGYGKRNHYLHIAVAPTKSIDRFEWFLEKATEIGVDEITPLTCARSERKEVNTDRLNKVITSAVKQSIKAYHPKLNPATSFKNFIRDAQSDHKFIAHCIPGVKHSLSQKLEKGKSCVVLVGPEGDFSPEEVDEAEKADFVSLSLGDSRLRTETAALEACFEVNLLNR